MSSDSLSYALENNIDITFRNFKQIQIEEWEKLTKNCKAKRFQLTNSVTAICKCTDLLCNYDDCFARFCQTVRA
jgi:hypothetical protein